MSAGTEQRKLAAIMFTDMVGYSALSQRNEALALELLDEHRRVVRGLLPRHSGREVKTTGDGFLLEFPSALAAVQGAVEIQNALHERNQVSPPERQLRIRIGIHVGDVVMKDGDIHGDGVNIAARIEPLAAAGGICISSAVQEQVRNKLAQPLAALGPAELKNIELPVVVHRVVLPWETAGSSRGHEAQTSKSAIGNRQSELRESLVTSAVTKFGWITAVVLLAAGGGWWFVHQSGKTTKQSTSPPSTTTATAPSPNSQLPTPTLPPPADTKSIAVLAFANLSEDKGNEYFSDGISEELLNVLAKVPGLKVAARTSAFYFKGKQVPMAEIAKQLDVAYVVEGSVRKSGNRVRITAQLIKAADGFHVWSENFDRELKDIFAVQDEIAGLIAKNLQLKLGNREQAARVVNPEAYRLALEGRHFWNLRTFDGFDRAEAAYRQAITLDPNFAEAHSGLAAVLVIRINYRQLRGIPATEAELDQVEPPARRAIELDPSLAEPHAVLGFGLMLQKKRDEAAREFAEALRLNSNSALAHGWNAFFECNRGRLAESISEFQRAIELDPLWAPILFTYAVFLDLARQPARALELHDRAAALSPDLGALYQGLRVKLLLDLGRNEEAVVAARALKNSTTQEAVGSYRQCYIALALWRAGHRQEASDYCAEKLDLLSTQNFLRGYLLTTIGRFDEALPYLEQIQPTVYRDIYWNTIFDPFRDDPRFRQLVAKLGITEEYRIARDSLAQVMKEKDAKK